MTKSAMLAALLLFCAVPATARADCAEELGRLRARLHEVKDDHRRREIEKLAEKAELDRANGRERSCADTVARARTLLP